MLASSHKLKLRFVEKTEGWDFVLEGNMLDDKLIDVTHYMSVQGH